MSLEVWVDVAGFEGDYQVSSLGRVQSFKGRRSRILKPYVRGDEYHEYSLSNGALGVTAVLVHRLVAEAFIAPVDGKLYVNHKNGLPSDNSSINLEWCTQAENVQHAYDTGLKAVGEGSYQAKLTEDDVKFIKANYTPRCKKFGCKPLGEIFGVHPGTISAIIQKRAWARVI